MVQSWGLYINSNKLQGNIHEKIIFTTIIYYIFVTAETSSGVTHGDSKHDQSFLMGQTITVKYTGYSLE